MPSIGRECLGCKKYFQVEIDGKNPIRCPQCEVHFANSFEIQKVFERCPVCECRQFYIHKDFNQALGCLIMLIGIILVPFTYGISLPIFALIDWLLHKRVGNVVICYKCHSEFRGFSGAENFKNFMHHIGVKYDK